MTSREFCSIAGRLMRHPSVPFHEHAVRGEVEAICAEHGLSCERDRAGNVLVRLRSRSPVRPLALAAHLDHPGFDIRRRLSRTGWLGQFLGGVPDPYFRPGVPLLLMPGGHPAKLGRRRSSKEYQITTAQSLDTAPEFAVWALEDFSVRRGRIVGRACDDLVGVAAILATLIELKRSGSRVHVVGVLSRAEEIGLVGAMQAVQSGTIPKGALVVSLETSRELPGVRMGNGVILRVGDRASVFNPEAMRFLSEVAVRHQARARGFRFQRGLMSGGTCEASAYQEFGLQTAGVCVALGNYHNCAARNRIAAEYVSVADAVGMVDLLVSAARQMPRYDRLTGGLSLRLHRLLRGSRKRLLETA